MRSDPWSERREDEQHDEYEGTEHAALGPAKQPQGLTNPSPEPQIPFDVDFMAGFSLASMEIDATGSSMISHVIPLSVWLRYRRRRTVPQMI